MKAAKEEGPLAFRGRCFFTNKHLVISVVLDIVDNTSLSMGRFRCLFSIVFLFPLDIFSEVELLGHVVLMVLIF